MEEWKKRRQLAEEIKDIQKAGLERK